MMLQSSTTPKEAEERTDSPVSEPDSPKPTGKKKKDDDDGRPVPVPVPVPVSVFSYNREELESKFPDGCFPRTYVPLASTLELDPNRPTPVEVFGQRYVVYRRPLSLSSFGENEEEEEQQQHQRWVVMDDACPHRLAPLSEGRVILPPPPASEKDGDKNKNNNKKKESDGSDGQNQSPSSLVGNIQCSYHGWTYDGSDGRCTSIPQASADVERAALKKDSKAAAANNNKCQVPTYSTIVDRSVIWFWPWKQDAVEATVNAATGKEGLKDDGNDGNDNDGGGGGGWDITPSGLADGCPSSSSSTYTRELPYSYDILVENLLDPSHVPFAHHGLQGSRADAIPIEMSVPSVVDEGGFSFDWTDRTMGMMRRGEGRWQAPFTVRYDAKFYDQDPQKDFDLAVLCIPVRPGWSRAILFSPGSSDNPTDDDDDDDDDDSDDSTGDGNSPATKKETSSSSPASLKTKLIRAVFSSIPIWVVHQLNSRFLDSDLAFLHFQELERSRRQKVISAAASPTKKATMNGGESYFMPAASDRCVSALRSWFTKYTDDMSGLGRRPAEERELPRSELFDRWSQHTSKCVHCQNGLKQLAMTRKVLFGITALSLLFGIGKFVLLSKVLFLMSLAAQPLITNIEKSFKEGGFKHYENH